MVWTCVSHIILNSVNREWQVYGEYLWVSFTYTGAYFNCFFFSFLKLMKDNKYISNNLIWKRGRGRSFKINNTSAILVKNYLLVVEKWKTIILDRFVPSYDSFGRAVPDENLKKNQSNRTYLFYIDQSETRTAYGGHISCTIGTKYGNLIQDLPYIISTKYQFIMPPSFRWEYFLNFNQSETRIVHVDHVFLSNWN